MYTLPKAIYTFNSYQNSNPIFHKIEKKNPKISTESEKALYTQSNLEEQSCNN